MQQTAADGFSLAEGTRRELGRAFNFQADIGRNPYTFTSHRSPGINEFSDTPATSRGRSEHREKQAVRSRWMIGDCYFCLGDSTFDACLICCICCFLLFTISRFSRSQVKKRRDKNFHRS